MQKTLFVSSLPWNFGLLFFYLGFKVKAVGFMHWVLCAGFGSRVLGLRFRVSVSIEAIHPTTLAIACIPPTPEYWHYANTATATGPCPFTGRCPLQCTPYRNTGHIDLAADEGRAQYFSRTFTCGPRPESGSDCLTCAIFADCLMCAIFDRGIETAPVEAGAHYNGACVQLYQSACLQPCNETCLLLLRPLLK